MHAGRNDAADVARSLAAGELVPTARPQTIADGLQGKPRLIRTVNLKKTIET